MPWKSVISARGLRRARPGTPASVLLALLIVIAVATGIGHAAGWWSSVLTMQLHVGAALLSIPLAAWHIVRRPVPPRASDLSRRSLLRAGAIAGGGIVAFAAVEGLVRVTGMPGADRRATGSYERGSFEPGSMPVTQWLDDEPPRVDPEAWRLLIRSSASERTWSYRELAGAAADHLRATLDCTGGWFATQDWSGVRLDRLIPVEGGVRSFLVVSATGSPAGSRSRTPARCSSRSARTASSCRRATGSRPGSWCRAGADSGG